jgi:hypothetical protein
MVQVVPWFVASDLLAQKKFDYLVAGRFVQPAGETSATEFKWARAKSSFVRRASFGHAPVPMLPYFWHTNDEQIFIFARHSD